MVVHNLRYIDRLLHTKEVVFIESEPVSSDLHFFFGDE